MEMVCRAAARQQALEALQAAEGQTVITNETVTSESDKEEMLQVPLAMQTASRQASAAPMRPTRAPDRSRPSRAPHLSQLAARFGEQTD